MVDLPAPAGGGEAGQDVRDCQSLSQKDLPQELGLKGGIDRTLTRSGESLTREAMFCEEPVADTCCFFEVGRVIHVSIAIEVGRTNLMGPGI